MKISEELPFLRKAIIVSKELGNGKDTLTVKLDFLETLLDEVDKVGKLENQRDALLKALTLISEYDERSSYGEGICPYGCDCPHIAKEAIESQNNKKEKAEKE